MPHAPIRLLPDNRPPEPRKFVFTKATIEQFGVGQTRRWCYDTKRQGLALLVTPKGSRSFYWVRNIDGVSKRQRLGTYPTMTVEQARKLATQKDGELADGIDPTEARRASRHALTFGEAFTHYLDSHAKPKKRRWREDEQKFDLHLKPLHNRKLSSITRPDLQAIVTRIGTGTDKAKPHPIAANRLCALLSVVFNVAIDDFGLAIPNPAAKLRKFPERQRERFLNAEELGRFYAALANEPQIFQDVFELLLLSGARSGNVKAMRWEQLDLADQVWTIPASEAKSNRQIVIPLATRAAEILACRLSEAQDRAEASGEPVGPWVFPSHRRHAKNPHLVELKSSWARIVKAAKLEGVRVHDLRHTFASWQAKTGSSLQIIGRTLGHSRPATTSVYVQTELDQVRAAVDAAATAMTNHQAKGRRHGKA